MTLGQRIKSRREELKLGQEQLSAIAGISQSQISRYEKDESQPNADSILALSKALRVPSDWLLGIVDSAKLAGLDEQEEQVITLFRAKSDEFKSAIMQILRLA